MSLLQTWKPAAALIQKPSLLPKVPIRIPVKRNGSLTPGPQRIRVRSLVLRFRNAPHSLTILQLRAPGRRLYLLPQLLAPVRRRQVP